MVKEARGIGGGSSNGGAGEVKKGPWTTTEDEVLLEYVRRQGEGNWNSVQRNSGLQRCGKSCRLRWANHLRPHLKKGPFTPQEERIIIDLHSKLGNKWARMAAQLPGRTDNEIKNYWNTRLKRRQRAGLPLYPHGIIQQQQHHHQPTVLPTISTSHSLDSILSAGSSSFHLHHHHRTATTHLNSPASTLSFLNYPPYRNNINPTNNGLSGLSFSNPQANTPKMSLFNQSLSRNSLPFDALVFNNSDLAAATRATSFDRVGLFQMGSGTNTGFSPIAPQTPVPPAAPTTQTSSGYTGTDGMFGGASNEYDQITSSGLLGDLLEESQVIKSGESSNGKIISAHHVLMENDSSGYTGCDGMFGGASTEYDQIASSGLLEDLLEESQVIKSGESSNGKIISEDHGLMENDFEVFGVDSGHGHGNFISAHSNTGTMNAEKEVTEEMNEVDDELLRLLDCPSPGPISDWCDFGSSSNVNSNVADDGPAVITESYDQTSLAGPTTSETVNHTLGNDSCCWKYMPGALY